MRKMSEQEWSRVQECLVRGGLRECIDEMLTTRVFVTQRNLDIIRRAYDAGDGIQVGVHPGDGDWFIGVYDDFEVFQAKEHGGRLYALAYASGGGLVTLFVGQELADNNPGLSFHGMAEAKAYVEGLTAL